MDSARDFDLLGESVPQVRVSARTLALLGFFQLQIYIYTIILIALCACVCVWVCVCVCPCVYKR